MSLRLSYLPPPEELADIVSVFYLFETDDPRLDELERADIAQLRFNLEGEGELVFPAGETHTLPRTVLLGPRMTSSRVIASGPARVFGCGVWPGGWASIVGNDASAYANRAYDAAVEISAYLGDLPQRLKTMTDIKEMVEAFHGNHRACADRLHPAPFAFIHTVDAWLENALDPDVADLVAQCGIGQRSVERMVKKLYGASPKLLARKYRALRAANAIANGDGAWQDYAMDLYYDHSHCIREIKAFVGITPNQIKGHAHQLLQLTFGRRQLRDKISALSALS